MRENMADNHPTDEPTRNARKRCAEWLALCVRVGWDKSKLDALERLWWEHHDRNGNLKDEAKPR